MNKKLVFFDQTKFNRHKIVFLKNQEVLNQIGEKYKALGIGPIDIKRAQEIISGNFANTEADVIKAVSKEAKNSLVKDFIKTGTFESLENFQIEVSSLVSKFDRNQHTALEIIPTPIQFFEITSGNFSISDETWQRIKDERCSNFISTPKEQKLLSVLQKLCDVSNEFMSLVGPNAKNYFPSNSPGDFIVFDEDEGLYVPELNTDFEYLTQ